MASDVTSWNKKMCPPKYQLPVDGVPRIKLFPNKVVIILRHLFQHTYSASLYTIPTMQCIVIKSELQAQIYAATSCNCALRMDTMDSRYIEFTSTCFRVLFYCISYSNMICKGIYKPHYITKPHRSALRPQVYINISYMQLYALIRISGITLNIETMTPA